MNKFAALTIIAAALAGLAAAQTGPGPGPADSSAFALAPATLRSTNSPEMTETEILSESAYFDLKGRTAIYMGDVKVRDPRMDLSCEVLTVHMAPSGGKFDSIVAETNVAIDFLDEKGQKVHGTGGKAIYTYNVFGNYTNDVLELMDNPVLKTVQGDWYGDTIKLDRVNNTISGTHSRMIIRNTSGDTNSIIPAPMP
jgi:lipopolysaccharide export system protein LptA